jgi:hypothetical protein
MDMTDVTPLAPGPADLADEIQALARRQARANGPLIALVTRLGGTLEGQLKLFPESVRAQILRVTEAALQGAWEMSARGAPLAERAGARGTYAAAVAAGAAGGAGGLPSALAELPVTVTLILTAIRAEAAAQGFDPEDPAIRTAAIEVFGAGSAMSTADDGINTAFLSARLTLTGPALQKVIATVAPKLATALGQKLAAQAVPVVGAISGAAINAAFLTFYREMAAIRFALLRLAGRHGEAAVAAAWRAAVATGPVRPA